MKFDELFVSELDRVIQKIEGLTEPCQHNTLQKFSLSISTQHNVTQWLKAMLIAFKHIYPLCLSNCAMINK